MRQEYEREYVEFVSTRLPPIRRLAYHLCGDWHQADDLMQIMLTRLFVKWPTVRDVTEIEPYVRAMLVKTFLTENRRAWTRVSLVASPPEATERAGVDIEQRAALRQALAGVPARQRAALVLRFIHDLPVAEVAEILGCSAGTVKSQTHHGLIAMRRLLEPSTTSGQPAERTPVTTGRDT